MCSKFLAGDAGVEVVNGVPQDLGELYPDAVM